MSNYPIKDAEELAELFKALANPHRLKIFIGLARCCRAGEACAPNMRACVGELGDGLDLAPSTVSHHLKELRRAGLIHMKRAGQHVECWADPEALARLCEFFRFAGGEMSPALAALAEGADRTMGETR
jgi:ArsR family transcriptional regulator